MTLLLTLGSTLLMYGQGGLDLVGRVKVDGGIVSGTKVIVLRDGKKVKTLTSGLAKFELTLDLNSNYILSFEKNGFVTKKLQFNTHVSDMDEEKIYAPFGFTVNLFEQYDDVNIVVFNQPVGMIRYEEDLGEFDYDTDYTKSIQSQLDDAMKAIEQKKKEAAKLAKKQAKEQEKQEQLALKKKEEEQREAEQLQRQKEEEARKQALAVEEAKNESVVEPEPEPNKENKEPVETKEIPVVPKPEPKPARVTERPRPVFASPLTAPANSGSESRQSFKVNEGSEINPVRMAKAESFAESKPEKIISEQNVERFEDIVVEKNRVITKVKYVHDDGVLEYMKVYHKWGGTFYFKNGASCSQTTFELETGGFELASEE